VCSGKAKSPGKTVREKAKTRFAAKTERSKRYANEISDFFRSLFRRCSAECEFSAASKAACRLGAGVAHLKA